VNVVEVPAFGWLGPVFVCGACGARVRFELSDRRDKAWKARETLTGGWAVRARCVVCANPLAQFRQEDEDA
jgi:hypothetical protein